MKKFFLSIFLIFPFFINSQSVGDIAFIAYNADGHDDLAFVALSEISSGTVIYFTDNEWTGSAFNNTNEGRVEWTATSTVDAGTVVVITDINSSESVNVGSVSEIGNFNIGASDDCVWALSAAPATSYGSTPTFYGVICNDIANGDTISGTGLTLGTNGINFDNDKDGFLYTGSRTDQASFSDYLSQIYNSSNWQQETSNGENILPISTTAFTVSGGSTDPEPSNHPSGLSASVTHEKITLTWTDAVAGVQAPSKYLIIGETDNSIDDPADGTAISSDGDASDNRITINVEHGSQTTSFSNVGNNTWYFEIFPYTNSGSSIDYKTDGTIETATATTSAIQITEIVYNSPGSDWEWLELYNPTGSSIDISGYTIADASNNTLTFSSGISINSQSHITVSLGGSGTAQFSPDFNGSGNVSYTYSYGLLNNSGDTITLKDASSNIVDQLIYDDASPWPTSPDGTYYSLELISGSNNYYGASWQASYAEYGSPGKSTSTAWNNSLGSGDNLTISSPDNIVISADRSINNITINSGASLTIEKSGSLTVAGDFTNNGTVKLQSDSNEFAAIKVTGNPSGDITYKRYVNTVGSNEWDLIGSPVGGNNYISSFITANSGRLATNGSSPTLYAVGYYNNSADTWTNYNSTSVINNSTAFDPGEGYQMAHSSGGVLDFTGTIPTATVTEPIINNHGNGSGRRWNLVANPFPAYINANDDAHATNNFIDINTSQIDDTNYLFVYGYDADGTGYTAYGENYNNNDTPVYIAPGQGFFIAAESNTSSNVSFTTAMQTITGTDDFVSGDTFDDYGNQIQIRLYKQNMMIEDAHIYFNNDVSAGLDPGRDAGDLNQSSALMSRLIDNDEGVGFAIQELPMEMMIDCVVPLEINTYSNEEFRINLHTSTIENTYVYLEDTVIEYMCTGEYSPGCEAGISPASKDIDWSLCDADVMTKIKPYLENPELMSPRDLAGYSLEDWSKSSLSNQFVVLMLVVTH